MKKNIVTLAAITALFLGSVNAQTQQPTYYESMTDVVVEKQLTGDENLEAPIEAKSGITGEGLEKPEEVKPGITIDYLAPLGEGLLILGCLGGAYLVGKRRKERE